LNDFEESGKKTEVLGDDTMLEKVSLSKGVEENTMQHSRFRD